MIKNSPMKQYEAVIEAMKQNGGYATLAHLNRTALEVAGCEWKTKTPFASIRRIVQDSRFFFRLRPGLWALKSQRSAVMEALFKTETPTPTASKDFDHSYYQGLLVELGNAGAFQTFVPNQDRNKSFLGKPLGQLATLPDFLPFTYDPILRRGRTIDVTWFNDRGFPAFFFEVEHSTDIQNSLLKYLEFRDFTTQFKIVADRRRAAEFDSKLKYSAFSPIKTRVAFIDYDKLSEYHAKACAARAASADIGL